MIAAPGHEELHEELNAYLDGELDAARKERVVQHVAACDLCRQDIEELTFTKSALKQLPAFRAPRPFFLTASDIPATRPASAAPHPRGFDVIGGQLSRVLAWGWRFGSAAAAVCLFLAVLTGLPGIDGARKVSEVPRRPASVASAPQTELADRNSSQRVAPAAPAQARAPATDAAGQAAPSLAAPASAPIEGAAPRLAPAPTAAQVPPPLGGSAGAVPSSASDTAGRAPGSESTYLQMPGTWIALALAFGTVSGALFLLERRRRQERPA
jgi:hypothetical protein